MEQKGILTKNKMDTGVVSKELEKNVPEQFREPYLRMVTAGMKLMLSEAVLDKTNIEEVASDGELLGQSVAAIVAHIVTRAPNFFPGEVLIPAGIELLMQSVRFAEEAGYEIEQETINTAMHRVIYAIMEYAGADKQQLDSAMADDGDGIDAESQQEDAGEMMQKGGE